MRLVSHHARPGDVYFLRLPSRRNENVRMNMLGIFPFTAPYLAWVLMGFSFMIRSPLVSDLVSNVPLWRESMGGSGSEVVCAAKGIHRITSFLCSMNSLGLVMPTCACRLVVIPMATYDGNMVGPAFALDNLIVHPFFRVETKKRSKMILREASLNHFIWYLRINTYIYIKKNSSRLFVFLVIFLLHFSWASPWGTCSTFWNSFTRRWLGFAAGESSR